LVVAAVARTLRASADELKTATEKMCQEHLAAGKELGEHVQSFADFMEVQKKNRTKVFNMFCCDCFCHLFFHMCSFSFNLNKTAAIFYAQKQLLLSAHLSQRNSVCPSVCLSICLSHSWINQKQCKIGSPNLHHWLPGRL